MSESDDGGSVGDAPVVDAVDKPSVYFEDVNGTMRAIYRASSLYGCENALLASRMGVGGSMPPDWLQERFDAGHDHEPLILGKIQRKFGFQPYGFQLDVEVEVGTTALIRGHIDALDPIGNDPLITHYEGEELRSPQRISTCDHEYGNNVVVVDAKALSQLSFEKWASKGFYAFPYYGWQQRIYVHGLEADGVVMAVKNKNTDAMIVDYYPRNSRHLAPIGPILARVMANETVAREQGESALFPGPCVDKQFPCPYWQFCWERPERDKGQPLDEGTLVKIGGLASQRIEAKAAAKVAEDEAKELDRQIVEMVGRRVITGKTPAGTVSTYHHSSGAVDWDAIAEAAGMTSSVEAKEKFSTTVQSPRLSVRITPPRKAKAKDVEA